MAGLRERLYTAWLLAAYYVKRLKIAIAYLLTLYAILAALIVASGRPLTISTIVSILTFSQPPRNELEGAACVVAMLINSSPLLGIFEFKMITPEEKARLKAKHMAGHVVVVGYSHLGARMCRALEAAGIPFVLVVSAREAEREEVRSMLGRGVPVIVGDPAQSSTLRDAGVDKARAVVVTVDDDTLNLMVAEKAKEINRGVRVVVRMFREELANIAVSSGFADEALSTSYLSFPMFVASCFVDVELVEGLVPIKAREGSRLVGLKLSEVEVSYGVTALALIRDGKVVRDPDARVSAGDVVLVVGAPDKIAALA